ncbi:MAG: hypothetical protein ACRC2V_07380, partial [Xenococcaceae cyanobacterium]
MNDLNPKKSENSTSDATVALDSLVELLLDLAPSNLDTEIAPQANQSEPKDRTQKIDRTGTRLTTKKYLKNETDSKNLQPEPTKLERSPYGSAKPSNKQINTNKENLEAFSKNSAIAPAKIADTERNSKISDLEPINRLIKNLEQKLQQNKSELDALVETTDTLIPLLVELLKSNTAVSEGIVVKAVMPIIDRIIQQRASQDRGKMAAALADIIP